MMELTRKGEYAIRGIIYLAQQPAGRVSLVSEIAQASDVPPTFLAKIFQSFAKLGLVTSTRGTARALRAAGIPVTEVLKVHEGRPNIVDALTNGEVQIVINTPFGQETRSDGYHIRAAAIRHGVTNITTMEAAQAAAQAIEAIKEERLEVSALQDVEQWAAPVVRDLAAGYAPPEALQ